ncbi:hypothetical protein Ccrd_016784, partial [Cynara cardunculus var. scolymus]
MMTMLESAWSLSSRSHRNTFSNSPCSEFDTNGGFRLQKELITGKPRKDVRFSNSRIPN